MTSDWRHPDDPCPECFPDRPDARMRYRCPFHVRVLAGPSVRAQAEDVLFTQCQGCTACQTRAKAVARAYLALVGITDAAEQQA